MKIEHFDFRKTKTCHLIKARVFVAALDNTSAGRPYYLPQKYVEMENGKVILKKNFGLKLSISESQS